MNAIFAINMQAQLQRVEFDRELRQQQLAASAPVKGSPAYEYLSVIFKHGEATTRMIKGQNAHFDRKNMPAFVLKPFIKNGLITYTATNNAHGIYKPAKGVTPESLGIELISNSH